MTEYLDLDNPDHRRLIGDVVAEVLAKQAREHPSTRWEFGTVSAHTAQPEQALSQTLVQLAGDPADHAIPAVNLLPNAPKRGDRVAVVLDPPSVGQLGGVYIVGTVPDTMPCSAVVVILADTEDFGDSDHHPFVDPVYNTDIPICGFTFGDSDDDGAYDVLIIPETGTYAASAGVVFNGTVNSGTVLQLDVLMNGNIIATARDRMDANHLQPSLQTATRLFYAERGYEVAVTGASSSPTSPIIASSESFLAVWQICCGYEPAVGETPPPPEE